jgi:hypothetical protein
MIMDVCCLEARPNLGQKTPRISRFGKNPVRSRNLGLHLILNGQKHVRKNLCSDPRISETD